MRTFSQISAGVSGRVIRQTSDAPVQHLLTDSRKVGDPATTLFFAIRGTHHDGHQFVDELHRQGVRQFVLEDEAVLTRFSPADSNLLLVANSIRALQQITATHRSGFSLPVIGITGSNGKTIVKEWLAALLGDAYRIVKSPKSYNSQVGVPLSVWQINESHTLGIFEAGISRPGEMAHLADVIQPTIGIFTNIGTAHDEGFANPTQKIREKAQLFRSCAAVIYCRDHTAIHDVLTETRLPNQQAVTWSMADESAAVFVQRMEKKANESLLHLKIAHQAFSLRIPFTDHASVENSLHAITLMHHLGMSPEVMQSRLDHLHPVAMRLEMKEGINGCYLIDDTYNNDLAGLTMGLEFLQQQRQKPTKTVILSDVLESGLPADGLYQRINALLESKSVHRLIGIGEEIIRHRNRFRVPATFYPTTEDFLRDALVRFSDELILIKGARTFRFERIVQKLLRKYHRTVLEINLDAISANLNYFRGLLGGNTRLMAMVKAFAYGSGSAEIANRLQFHRVDYLTVAYADEGVFLRENGIQTPIMVMNPTSESFDALLAHDLEPELYSMRILHEWMHFLETKNQPAPVHVKLDTGMHRLGFAETELPEVLEILLATGRIRVASVFTHLAASGEATHDAFTHEQVRRFRHMADTLENALGYRPLRHVLNSGGIARFPDYRMDMVRLGIGLYGVGTDPQEQAHLATVGTLKTVISQIKHVRAGETVGYSRRGVVTRDTTIATIAIGYADGFDRRLSRGAGKVWINGKFAPVIGNVCMDMTMVDITDIPAQEGDEVIVFGKELPITEMAHQAGTIPYELLTGIGERVKRVFYSE